MVVSGFIENSILAVETSLLTDIFILVMLVVFVTACIFKKADKVHAYTHYAPTLLTTLGILGTFFGIVSGLLSFDVNNIDDSIGALLAGMKTAFTTSLVGMCLSILFKVLVSFNVLALKREAVIDEEQLGVVELYTVMTQQRDAVVALTKAIGSGDESSLIGQTKLLRSDMNDSMNQSQLEFEEFQERLWVSLQQFADMLSKSATETVIEALNRVINDFNQNLTEQFGENFKQLNEAVLKLVEWQEQYKSQLGEMSVQYSKGVTAITDTEVAVAKISENTKQIPESMGQLSEIITVNQHQIEELSRHLQAFRDIRDKAVDAVPELDARIEQTLTGVESATGKLSKDLAEVTTQVVGTINSGTEQFIIGVNKSNEALVESSQAVANDSGQIKTLFQDATTNLDSGFREMANTMVEHSKSVAENLKSSGDALVEEATRSRQSFESGLSVMRDELASALMTASEQQTQEMQRLIESVEKTMADAINKTGQSVETQVNTLDQALQEEINRSLKEMGSALVSITGQFTRDYQLLVSEMQTVIKTR